MITLIVQRIGRLFETAANDAGQNCAVFEQIEGRILMSASANTDHPMLASDAQPTALLLPAVQAVREAAARAKITDGTSNTIMFGEAVK